MIIGTIICFFVGMFLKSFTVTVYGMLIMLGISIMVRIKLNNYEWYFSCLCRIGHAGIETQWNGMIRERNQINAEKKYFLFIKIGITLFNYHFSFIKLQS